MMRMNNRVVFIALTSLLFLHTINTNSYSGDRSQNELLIGKDPMYNSNVFLHKDSITSTMPNVKRAVYCVDIDKITEEYTADYNCYDKTIHIFSVAIKDSKNTIEEKKLYINEKVAKGTIDARLLDAVCKYNN